MREIPWSDLTLLKRIGSGGFSTVFLATWRGEQVAVKKLLDHAAEAEEAASLYIYIYKYIYINYILAA